MGQAKHRKWTKPRLKRLGSIHDVEGAQLSSSNQLINTCGTNGYGTCKS